MTPTPIPSWIYVLLGWTGGITATVIGSWISSRIRLYHDYRKAHLEDLQRGILVPIREGLDHHFRPLVFNLVPILLVDISATTHFDFKARATEEQVEQGDVLVAAFPSAVIFKPLAPALLEDATKIHFAEPLALVDKFMQNWTAYAAQCHSWALRISQEILARSGLPAFPARHSGPGIRPYVMHLRLAVFVYKRLFRLDAPALRPEEMYPGPTWILNGEGCTAALGTKEQIERLVAQIDKLIDSEQAAALDIKDKLTELQREFQALVPRLDYAIAVRRLRKKCDLVTFF